MTFRLYECWSVSHSLLPLGNGYLGESAEILWCLSGLLLLHGHSTPVLALPSPLPSFTPLWSMMSLKSLLSFSDSQPLFSALFSAWVVSFSVNSFQTGKCPKSKNAARCLAHFYLDSPESCTLNSLLPCWPFEMTKKGFFMCWSAFVVVLSEMVSLKQVVSPLTEAEIALNS